MRPARQPIVPPPSVAQCTPPPLPMPPSVDSAPCSPSLFSPSVPMESSDAEVIDPCALCEFSEGQIIVRPVDHHFHTVNFMRTFVFQPPQPNFTKDFWLCELCAQDCVNIRRPCDRIVLRKANRGKIPRGRPKKRKAECDPAMLGIHRSTSSSSATGTSPLDRRKRSSFSVVELAPTVRCLDSQFEDCNVEATNNSPDVLHTEEEEEYDGEIEDHVLPRNIIPRSIRELLADLQAHNEVSGNNAGLVWSRCNSVIGNKVKPPCRTTAHRCLLEKAVLCLEDFSIDLTNVPRNLVFGEDATTTFDARHMVENSSVYEYIQRANCLCGCCRWDGRTLSPGNCCFVCSFAIPTAGKGGGRERPSSVVACGVPGCR